MINHRLITDEQRDNTNGVKPENEIYTNGYMRSGNTWLGRLLSDALHSPLQLWNDYHEIAFFGAERDGQYVIRKRHTIELLPETCKIVYIYRDPRDVAVSTAHYRLHEANERNVMGIVREFVTPVAPDETMGRYEKFLRTWIHRDDICMTSYERLSFDTVNELSKIVQWITGETPDQSVIWQTVERQSFDKVQDRFGDLVAHSMWKGKTGQWRKYFTPEISGIITDGMGTLMLEQGYIDSLDWYFYD